MGTATSVDLSVHVTEAGILVHTKTSCGYGVWMKVQMPPEASRALKANDPVALAMVREKVDHEIALVQSVS